MNICTPRHPAGQATARLRARFAGAKGVTDDEPQPVRVGERESKVTPSATPK
jgi:hypothetical protein